MRTRSLKSYVYFALTALIVALMVSPSAKAQTRDLAELKGRFAIRRARQSAGRKSRLPIRTLELHETRERMREGIIRSSEFRSLDTISLL